MGSQIKLPWWQVGRGEMDRNVQAEFEKAQALAQELQAKISVVITLEIDPPRPTEPDYQSVHYGLELKKPKFRSRELFLVRKHGVAVRDAEDTPDQEHLQLEMPNLARQEHLQKSDLA